MEQTHAARAALRFIVALGVANFFADFTYEGARGITGPFLASLGASASVVGFVAGFGELVCYSLRSVTGYVADRTRKYWLVTFSGYFINLLAVPALALAGNWPIAAGLIVAERTGRAVRKPAVDMMISDAGRSIGSGWAFGLNEALDQAGATLGPLVVAWVLFRGANYQSGFALLLISALLCLSIVVVGRLGSCLRRPRRQIAVAWMGTASFLEIVLDLRSPRRVHRRGIRRFLGDRVSFS